MGLKMFIKAIGVRNYQSHLETVLSLGNLTIIYGQSDVGKSALYRAFRALVMSEQGDSFISTGTNRTGVSVLLSSGDKISWTKNKGKSGVYRFNEKVWQRSRNLPEEIAKKLRIFPIIVDGEKIYPNLRGQFDSLFMLFESSIKRARILGALISNVLLWGIRRANIERNRNEADVRAMQELVNNLQKAEEFPWDDYIIKAKAVQRRVSRGLQAVELYTKLVNLKEELARLDKVSKFKATLFSEKKFQNLQKVMGLYQKLQELRDYLQSSGEVLHIYDQKLTFEQSEVIKMQREVEHLKKQLYIVCPKCGYKINRLEIEK